VKTLRMVTRENSTASTEGWCQISVQQITPSGRSPATARQIPTGEIADGAKDLWHRVDQCFPLGQYPGRTVLHGARSSARFRTVISRTNALNV